MELHEHRAGPQEDSLTAAVSEEIYLTMCEISQESELVMGFAAVMTGVVDALARFACAHNMAQVPADDLAEMLSLSLTRLVRASAAEPMGTA